MYIYMHMCVCYVYWTLDRCIRTYTEPQAHTCRLARSRAYIFPCRHDTSNTRKREDSLHPFIKFLKRTICIDFANFARFHTNANARAQTNTNTYTHKHKHTHTHKHKQTHTHTRTQLHSHLQPFVCIYMHTYIYICAHTIQIYISHVHKYIPIDAYICMYTYM